MQHNKIRDFDRLEVYFKLLNFEILEIFSTFCVSMGEGLILLTMKGLQIYGGCTITFLRR